MIGHSLDRRDRSRTDKGLRKSQRQVSEAFRSSPDALFISTLQEGRILDVNEKFLRVSGCRRDEIIGLTLLELKFSNFNQQEPSYEQLHQADKMAALGQLAAGIVHDFNNVLNVISGYSELLLRESPENDASREKLRQIRGAADRGASLVRQILAFSRKHVIEPVTVDVNGLLVELQEFLQTLIGGHFELRIVFGSKLCPVKIDPGQFQQVLMNLVVNARDAMPDGGKVTIETSSVDVDERDAKQQTEVPPGHYSMITVSDTGCGMDVETKARIFERFFTTKKNGTGLGLATVNQIIRQSGGHMSVHSKLGHGSTFKVFLPAQNVVEIHRQQHSDARRVPSKF